MMQCIHKGRGREKALDILERQVKQMDEYQLTELLEYIKLTRPE